MPCAIVHPRHSPAAAALCALLVTSIAGAVSAQLAPPAAPKREVVDTYFGTAIADPYRWMEKPIAQNPEFLRWLEAQNAYTREVLDRLPQRAALKARLTELADIVTTVNNLSLAGSRWFYLKLKPGEQTAKLNVREQSGRERMLLDPDTLPGAGDSHWAIDYVRPSPDGRLVGYGSSLGGSEKTTLHLMDASTGRLLPDSISRVQFGGAVTWAPDGRSFHYIRLSAAGDTNPAERYRNSAAWRHIIGRPAEQDKLMLGPGSSSTVALEPDDFPLVIPVEGSPYIYASVVHGVRNEITLYVARSSDFRGAATAWRKLVDTGDAVVATEFHGPDIYLLSHKDAPRFKLLRVRGDAPDLRHAEVVVAEGKSVLTQMALAKDALYLQEREGSLGRLRRVPLGGGRSARIALPADGAIVTLATDRHRPGVVFPLESWTRSRLWYRYDPAGARLRDTGILSRAPVDVSLYQSAEVEVPSHDGTMVPLSIVRRKDLALDGSHPTVLEGYGAYGFSIDPFFDPRLLAWLERGGVYAVAHVRGGGEYGEEWHLAGKEATKPNTWKDFIACAEYLIKQRYTSAQHLAGTGTSAGGILIGRAMTERPDLFRAAVPRVGVMNALRTEHEPGGPANIPEFGSTTTEAGFRTLREMDAVEHVRPGVRYPAVLLTAGVHDSRVEAWQPAKMAAVLQERSASGYPVLLRVGFDAGHGMGLTKSQRVDEMADIYAFLLWQLEAGATP
jgi:prolyl oligopeptidase